MPILSNTYNERYTKEEEELTPSPVIVEELVHAGSVPVHLNLLPCLGFPILLDVVHEIIIIKPFSNACNGIAGERFIRNSGLTAMDNVTVYCDSVILISASIIIIIIIIIMRPPCWGAAKDINNKQRRV